MVRNPLLLAAYTFQPELASCASVEVVERIAHATGLCAPQLGVEGLDLLQFRVYYSGS